MKKELKDYLPCFIGCEAMYGGYGDPERKVVILGVSLKDGVQFQFWDNGEVDIDPSFDWFKLLLRPLSDMTEEEAIECGNLDYDFSGEPDLNKWTWKDFDTLNSSSQFQYLLSKHFDLFGLIEAGLAIDKTTLKQQSC